MDSGDRADAGGTSSCKRCVGEQSARTVLRKNKGRSDFWYCVFLQRELVLGFTVVLDLLAEYGNDNFDLVDDAVEITHWMPLPEAPKEGEKA